MSGTPHERDVESHEATHIKLRAEARKFQAEEAKLQAEERKFDAETETLDALTLKYRADVARNNLEVEEWLPVIKDREIALRVKLESEATCLDGQAADANSLRERLDRRRAKED